MLLALQKVRVLTNHISPHPQFAYAHAGNNTQGEVKNKHRHSFSPPAHPRAGGEPVQTSKMDTRRRGYERGVG